MVDLIQLLVQSVGAGGALGLIFLSLSYVLYHIVRFLHTIFTP